MTEVILVLFLVASLLLNFSLYTSLQLERDFKKFWMNQAEAAGMRWLPAEKFKLLKGGKDDKS